MGAINYLDFEIEIGISSSIEYPIAVLHSPAGEARTMMHWPFSALALEERLNDILLTLSHSSEIQQLLTPAEQAVQALGSELFNLLITGEVRNRYDVSQERARQQDKSLRLKLRIQPPALAVVPWEFLYDARIAEYVCLSRHTPIIRYLELPQVIRPLAITPPLRILGMVANPTDLVQLDIEGEKARIERSISHLQAKGLAELTWVEGQTWRDLQRALRGGPWHIFHFVGHGSFVSTSEEGMIVLANELGKAHFFSATDFSRLLADHSSLRLVLLNSCEGARSGVLNIFSSTAATLVRRGISAVVAMQSVITDTAATEFSHMFYESLADGVPVDAAVTEARKAVRFAANNSIEWGMPTLYMRSPDGYLFDLMLTNNTQPSGKQVEQNKQILPIDNSQHPSHKESKLSDTSSSIAEVKANRAEPWQIESSKGIFDRPSVSKRESVKFIPARFYKLNLFQLLLAIPLIALIIIYFLLNSFYYPTLSSTQASTAISTATLPVTVERNSVATPPITATIAPVALSKPAEATSVCGETSRTTAESISRLIRHQGVSAFTPENTAGAVLNKTIRSLAIDNRGLWIGYLPANETEIGGIGHYNKIDWADCNQLAAMKSGSG